MRILVTNDDGVDAHGLKVLREIAETLSSDVWVIAPERNQSGASHSLTILTPLRCRQLSDRVFAIGGTPTDCVIMGVRHIMADEPPTLVLSGINHGSNLAEDVSYSGTVSAATEGTFLGVRSIALSLMSAGDRDSGFQWETARRHIPGVISTALGAGWPAGTLLNVNVPDLPPDAIAGVAVTAQGRRDQGVLDIVERADPWGTPYFWFGFERRKSTLVEGTDLAAVAAGKISITPLSLDHTDHDVRAGLARAFDPAATTFKRPLKSGGAKG